MVGAGAVQKVERLVNGLFVGRFVKPHKYFLECIPGLLGVAEHAPTATVNHFHHALQCLCVQGDLIIHSFCFPLRMDAT